ncbi:poly-gamma-glutamate biosynthesis protein PgsC [Leptospira sp. 201903070]|jgi:gamma-polyglutamate biosynthesis protein CapC|uniref:Poly-gamma-glutamate biosynthesis protein PgsC n=1 Tax=Leptospira ainlahdjerensis TaxID=2810033 RepID=A0ABS2UEN8_9LEPT|nr:poly-gamma-glutamate biosynthesis protein PgsC [Leptospira ainlahdjerensis]MBM9578413.1 poly-gamma-glutamate biosynthesis protein PgsC [Leptospira ainlahdjerensis]
MEILTLSIGIGIFLGFFLWEKTGLYPGGWVVPGYIALSLLQPWTLFFLFASSLLTFGIYRIVEGSFLSFGQRKIVLLLLLSILISLCLQEMEQLYFGSIRDLEFRWIGHIVPGLLAISAEKQGLLRTISATILCSSLVRLLLILLLGESMVR